MDRAGVSDAVVEVLTALDQEALATRAGRTRYGYVEPTEAAWALLEEALQPWIEDIGRLSRIGLAQAARETGLGILGGLHRCLEHGRDDDLLLSWAIAIWTRHDGSGSVVQSAVRPVGRAWQPPVELSSAGQHASAPQVAVNARGDAVAIWTRRDADAENYIVQGAARPAGRGWQAPVDLSVVAPDTYAIDVEVDARGNAIAVWTQFDGSNYIVQSTAYGAG